MTLASSHGVAGTTLVSSYIYPFSLREQGWDEGIKITVLTSPVYTLLREREFL